ncbi:MAG TPA: hypothetical protein VFN67_37670 [Polyangiales bacterium]|nr:hypothetical protein [Polyangiales bacterium]
MNRLRIDSQSTRHLVLGACCALGLVACSAIVDTDKAKLGPVPVPCEQGQLAMCPCRDGSMSTQRCNTMARFDPCACGANAGRGGRAGADTVGSGRAGTVSTRSP